MSIPVDPGCRSGDRPNEEGSEMQYMLMICGVEGTQPDQAGYTIEEWLGEMSRRGVARIWSLCTDRTSSSRLRHAGGRSNPRWIRTGP
jgi:hypothetical protein